MYLPPRVNFLNLPPRPRPAPGGPPGAMIVICWLMWSKTLCEISCLWCKKVDCGIWWSSIEFCCTLKVWVSQYQVQSSQNECIYENGGVAVLCFSPRCPLWREPALIPFLTSSSLIGITWALPKNSFKKDSSLELFFSPYIKLQSFIFTLAYVYFNGRSWRGNWRREENYNRWYLPCCLWHENCVGYGEIFNSGTSLWKDFCCYLQTAEA